MERKHIVKSFDEDLALLKSKVQEMGRDSQSQIERAHEALLKRDEKLVVDVITTDSLVNVLQSEIDALTVRLLATRQPLALDLRNIISSIKIAADLERIADYASNIAKHVLDLNQTSLDQLIKTITNMTQQDKQMLENVMEAYAGKDISKAIEVWHQDDEVDNQYARILSDLRECMIQDPEHIKAYTSLLFVARCCERIGDHITNIAENIQFIEYGETYCGGGTA